jgi:excisionase family DNA binding protein
MDTRGHQQFLRETRDTIASWIGEPDIRDLFAADMQDAERHLREYKEEWRRITDEEKAVRKTPEGREWYDECARLIAQGKDEYPEPPQELRGTLPDSPLDKFRLPVKPGAFTIKDYRVVLSVVHDGFTWHESDKSRYICHELAGKGTIVDLLFWDHMWYEPRYQPLIREALDVVERDINERVEKQKAVRAERQRKQQGERLAREAVKIARREAEEVVHREKECAKRERTEAGTRQARKAAPAGGRAPTAHLHAIALMDPIIAECRAWLDNPSTPYPFKDLTFSEGKLVFYGTTANRQALTRSLTAFANLLRILKNIGRPGDADTLEELMARIKGELDGTQRGVDQGRRRELCIKSAVQAVREFVATLENIKRELQAEASVAGPTPPSPDTHGKSLPVPMDEGMRSYGQRFIAALKALHEVVERRDEATAEAAKHLEETVGSLDALADFLRAAITAAPAEPHMTRKALAQVEYAIKVHLGGPWHALAGGAAKEEGFSYDGFVGEIETALEAFDAAQPKDQDAGADDGVGRNVDVDASRKISLPEYSKPLSTTELADIFGGSRKTVLRRIQKGELDAKPHGRKWRIHIDQLPAEYVQKAIQK